MIVPSPNQCPVAYRSQSRPDLIAVHQGDQQIAYEELHRRITTCAGVGLGWGLQPGDRAALLAPSDLDSVTWLFAGFRLGVAMVPLNLRESESAWDAAVSRAGCKFVLLQENFAFAEGTFTMPTRPIRATPGSNEGQTARKAGTGRDQSQDAAESARTHSGPAGEGGIDPHREATLVFTSGSSGEAKGIRLSYANHYYNALGSNQNIPMSTGDTWLISLPLYHVSGLAILFRAFLAGASVRLCTDFGIDSLQDALKNEDVSHVSLVPTQLSGLLNAGAGARLSALKAILLGGAAAPEALLRSCQEERLPICVTYGMTETASQITSTTPADPPSKWRSSGICLTHRELAILNVGGKPVSKTEIGEIAVRGKVVMSGTLTEERNPNDWFLTGDLGRLDTDGYLWVVGRKDDLILSGGEKIYPAEIEKTTLKYPGVSLCKVVAEEDPVWGQRPALIVEVAADATFSSEGLYVYLEEKLGKLKLPARIGTVLKFPMTAMGKIDGQKLNRLIRSKNVNWHHE